MLCSWWRTRTQRETCTRSSSRRPRSRGTSTRSTVSLTNPCPPTLLPHHRIIHSKVITGRDADVSHWAHWQCVCARYCIVCVGASRRAFDRVLFRRRTVSNALSAAEQALLAGDEDRLFDALKAMGVQNLQAHNKGWYLKQLLADRENKEQVGSRSPAEICFSGFTAVRLSTRKHLWFQVGE